jgi:spermidine dehydrogenase
MSYQQLLEKMGYGPEVISFINPLIGVGNFGLAADAVSARAVQLISQPGTYPATEKSRWSGHPTGGSIAFPGGNAAIARAMVQRLFPGVIPGDARAALFPTQPMQLDGLDRPGSPVRMRLSSTVVRVEHDGDPASAGHVLITYAKDGKLHRIKAKSVVMGVGGWVSRRVVRDLPESHVEAYGKFNYGPVLTVNVAVRNWRFFSKLGFSSARWFNGFGWQVCVRRNMAEGGDPSPLTPDSPLMLTFYVPVQFPGESAAAQGALARQKIFETPFADYERQVRQQMTEMFGSAGFDAKRDIAGIVVNRWGHAFCAPAPGFFHGANGAPGARDIIRKPHGRVVFAHSELNGRMSMRFALNEGVRGGLEALEIARS